MWKLLQLKLPATLLIFLGPVVVAKGDAWSDLSTALGNSDFKLRNKAEADLISLALKEPSASVKRVHEMWKNEEGIEQQERLKMVLKALYQRVELGVGISTIEASFDWFLFHDGRYLSAYPQIVELDKDGVAAKAGMLPGDVLLEVDGIGMFRETSVPDLAGYFAYIKPGAEITFKIRRTGHGIEDPYTWWQRWEKKTFKVKTTTREQPLKEGSKGGFGEWLKGLSESEEKPK